MPSKTPYSRQFRRIPYVRRDVANVLIADESPTTLAGLRGALEAEGMSVARACATAAEAVEAVADDPPDAVLLGLELGGLAGAMRAIRAAAPDCEIVLFGDGRDPGQLLDLVAAGAHGILLGTADPDRIPAAVRGVLDGETAFPRFLVRLLADELAGLRSTREQLRARAPGLTDRECEVLDALARDVPVARIAARLEITPATVRRHIANAVGKLGVPDRAAALRLLAP